MEGSQEVQGERFRRQAVGANITEGLKQGENWAQATGLCCEVILEVCFWFWFLSFEV